MIILRNITENEVRRITRKLRIWFPGAVYHIMHRGVRRKPIFEDEIDYQVFLQILKTSLIKNNCILHAYCLMTNYIHYWSWGSISKRSSSANPGGDWSILSKWGYRGEKFGRVRICRRTVIGWKAESLPGNTADDHCRSEERELTVKYKL